MAEPAITARAYRYDPVLDAQPRYQTYRVATDEPISAMTLMRLIHEQDPSFACRTPMCFKGVCGSCLLRLNGKNVRGCATLVSPGEEVTLEPHPAYPLIRDLVVDFSQRSSGTSAGGD